MGYLFLSVRNELPEAVVAVVVVGVYDGGVGDKGAHVVDVVVESRFTDKVIDVVETVALAAVLAVVVIGQAVDGVAGLVLAELFIDVAVGVVGEGVFVFAVVAGAAVPGVGGGVEVFKTSGLDQAVELVVDVGVAEGLGGLVL